MKDKKNIIVIILMIVILAVGGYSISHKSKVADSDAKKFSEEYKEIDEKNPFVYRDLKEINKILNNGSGIIYLGFPECPWCQKYVTFLNEVAKDYELDKIYYSNILEDRKNNTEEYQKTVKILEEYLQYDDEGNKRIYVPSVIAVYKGEIVGFDDESAWDTKGFATPEEYWNESNISALKKRLEEMIIKANANICSECNK